MFIAMECNYPYLLIFYYRPIVKEIVIENLMENDIFIEPEYISSKKGVELAFEDDNSNSILQHCIFHVLFSDYA